MNQWFMKPPFLGLVCFGPIIDGYEVQRWTFPCEDLFADPYGWLAEALP